MSKVATPGTAHPASTPQVAHDKIAQRAYEKWVKRGRPHGTDKQDWLEAEAELKAELSKTSGYTYRGR